MSKAHQKHGNYSEAAMCHIHIAALIAEHLKRRNVITRGCSAFRPISLNVEKEEGAMKEDSGMQDVPYNEDALINILHTCADLLKKAERYELMQYVLELVQPYYLKQL